MSDIQKAERELNELIAAGKVLEGFERYYHDDVEMQENLAAPTVGKDANREREKGFWGSSKLNEIRILGSAAAGDRSFTKMFFDITMGNGHHMQMTEVAARQWKDGKIIHEQFFYDPQASA